MHEVKVSVILPIYNVREYLRDAIDSAIRQTLRDIEIICINDGSTDGSDQIIEEYKRKDERIVYISKLNSGYGHTMNVGLNCAKGKYIAILDSDDYIGETMFADLYSLAESNKADIVRANYYVFKGNVREGIIKKQKICSNDDMYNRLIKPENKDELFKGAVAHWSGLYRRDFLIEKSIKFNETPGASYQDTGFWFMALALAERIYMHDGYYYYYRQDNPNSSMLNKEKVYCISDEYDFIYNQLKRENIFKRYLYTYLECRFRAHWKTMARISSVYAYDFIMSVSRYFRDNKIDEVVLSGFERLLLDWLTNKPEHLYELYKSTKEYLHREIDESEYFYIYGAGKIAYRIFNSMSSEDRGKCMGVVVSDKKDKSFYFDDVMDIKDLSDKSVLIMICTAEKYRNEIITTLSMGGFNNYKVIDEMRIWHLL